MVNIAQELIKTYVKKIKEGMNGLVDEGLVISYNFCYEMEQNGKSQERTVA